MKKLIVLVICLAVLFGSACAENGFLIVCPDGAPALTVATLKDKVQTVAAETIAAPFSAEEADFIIAPVNAGAKLFKAGKSSYRLAAVVTWGNLVFASQIPDFSLETMNGRTVTLFGENTINASVALFILREKGVEPDQIAYEAGAKNTQELLMNNAEAIVMTAEPAVTVAKMKKEGITSISIAELYHDITGDEGFVQAGLFVREETLKENEETVKQWLEEIRGAADLCVTEPETVVAAAVEMGIIPNEKVGMNAIGNCHIHFIGAKEAREKIDRIVAIDPSQFGGESPADDFYYEAE